MKKYNTLIIGCGGQGCMCDAPGSENSHKIISFAHAFSEHPGFDLVGFVDKDSGRSIKAIETWGGHSFCCTSHALDDFGVEVAIVATNDGQHYEILKQLASHPLKLVICEKPICTDLAQAREIVALYQAKGTPLMVNYTRRFIPELQELKRRYEAGEFGKILDASYSCNRGVLHTESHAIDFFNWFSNGELKILERNNFNDNAKYRIWQIQLFFEKYFWQEQRIGDMPVPAYFDRHMWYVAENAYNFLEGREPLKCDGEMALRALEKCFELMP